MLVQMISGMRDAPQFTFFLIYLQEQFGLAPAAISGVVAGGQIAGMAAALLGGAITARLGSKWVLVCGLVLSGLSSYFAWRRFCRKFVGLRETIEELREDRVWLGERAQGRRRKAEGD